MVSSPDLGNTPWRNRLTTLGLYGGSICLSYNICQSIVLKNGWLFISSCRKKHTSLPQRRAQERNRFSYLHKSYTLLDEVVDRMGEHLGKYSVLNSFESQVNIRRYSITPPTSTIIAFVFFGLSFKQF